MKQLYLIFCVFVLQPLCAQYVGVGTSNPQQTLHIASPTGTIRVESLSAAHNIYNGGDTDGDGDLYDEKFPLYVDGNGDLTLVLQPLFNSGTLDAFENGVSGSSVTLLSTNPNGYATTVIDTYDVTVERKSVLELKYNISFEVYADPSGTIITDGLARRITNYVTVTGQTRKYGPTSKCYSSTTPYSVAGTYYNSCTTYITFPSAGTYTVSIIGEVSSDTTGQSGNVPPSRNTHIEFATGQDFIFARIF